MVIVIKETDSDYILLLLRFCLLFLGTVVFLGTVMFPQPSFDVLSRRHKKAIFFIYLSQVVTRWPRVHGFSLQLMLVTKTLCC